MKKAIVVPFVLMTMLVLSGCSQGQTKAATSHPANSSSVTSPKKGWVKVFGTPHGDEIYERCHGADLIYETVSNWGGSGDESITVVADSRDCT